MRRAARLGLLLALGCASSALRAQQLEVPRTDPFERGPRAAAREEAARGGAEPWSPVLRATLVGGAGSLANLGGVLLTPGEEIGGFRLLEVREFEAEFEKDGANLILALDPGASGP